MSTNSQTIPLRELAFYAAAAATCADRYAKAFYPMIRDADEKWICCVYASEDMDHYMKAAEVLRDLGVDLGGMVERPISQRGLRGVDVLETTASWAERAAFSVLYEGALLALLKGLAASDCAPIAKMAASVIEREEGHVAHGLRLLRGACRAEEGKALAQDAVQRLWPVALAVLDADEPRRAFAEAARVELGALGLSAPE
jgi:ring-1,2-phenylacetyl-CoA epoxidase subunit PaaA